LIRPEHIDILELIPQRPPFVMVDRLLSAGDRSVTSCLLISEDNIFVASGLFHESGLIENIAQTAAAMNGYHARIRGEMTGIGYLAGIRELKIMALPGVHKELKTTVTEEHNVLNTSIIRGQVHEGKRLIATCEMKVFMEDK
jgi:predicted hotdog family 3-hydroxylacyl-ACP dehydratase